MTVSNEDREHARIEAATAWVHKRWERYEFTDRDELVAIKALQVIEVADSPWMHAMIDALVENAYWGPKPAGEPITEHAVLMSGGSMQVRPQDEDDMVYPFTEWVAHRRRYGDRVFTRKVVVVQDWTEVIS